MYKEQCGEYKLMLRCKWLNETNKNITWKTVISIIGNTAEIWNDIQDINHREKGRKRESYPEENHNFTDSHLLST